MVFDGPVVNKSVRGSWCVFVEDNVVAVVCSIDYVGYKKKE